MLPVCDLHAHSIFSDGTDTPAQLLELGEEMGLSAVALTDHNTVAGLPDFLAAAEGKKIRAIAGAEFSADYNGTELHILGLFIKPERFGAVTDMTRAYHKRKEQSNIDLVERLRAAGYQLDYETIKNATPNGQVNRALIGAELARLGYVESVQDAFRCLLKPKFGYYVPPRRDDPFRVIEFVKSIGAVAVLAHPFLNLNEEELRRFLPRAVAAGLDGMETLYSTYDEETTAAAMKLADEFGLLHSGGSDYHGDNKPHIRLGVGRGNLAVPEELLAELEKRLNNC